MNRSSNNNNYNLDQSYKIFLEDYQRKFNSKKSELFCAIKKNIIECLNCGMILYDFQEYFFIVLPLQEIKNYTIKK
jgi:hypothetical protein